MALANAQTQRQPLDRSLVQGAFRNQPERPRESR